MPAISTVAIIGAGALGRDLAYLAASSGGRVILEDLIPSALRKAQQIYNSALDPKPFAGLIEYSSSLEDAAREADLIIETVPDELESKIEIFVLLDRICRPGAILASTTSLVPISDLAAVTYRPENCAGLRFPTPIQHANQLDILAAPQTAQDTLALLTAWARKLFAQVSVQADRS